MVDGRSEPERTEIELTSNAQRQNRWRHPHPDDSPLDEGEVVTGGTDVRRSPGTRSDQRRLYATAAIVGVVTLLLGLLIGRSGGGDDVSTSEPTTPVTSEASSSSLPPGESLPSATPTTTRPRPTTTTTIPPGLGPLSLYLVEVDPRLEGVELTLIGLEQRNVLAELDLARHTVIRRDFSPSSSEPSSMVVGDDWVVVSGEMASTVVHDDGSFEHVDLGEGWQPLLRAGTDRFWRPRDSSGWGPATLFEQVDLTGRPTGAAIELPANSWPSGSDPAGGLVVEAAGDLYSVGESSVEHLGSGDLIGISSDVTVTWDCDEQLRCGLVVTDRPSGHVRRVDVDMSGGGPIESLNNWAGASIQTISPDGSLCAVMQVSDDEPGLALIDLASGATYDVGDRLFLPVVAYSPDDRFVFLLANVDSEFNGGWGWGWGGEGDLFAYDRQTRDLFPVLSEPVEWQAMSTRQAPA